MQRRLWAEQPNAVLLNAFVARHDHDAFAALVERFGPLVWSVCRRQLGDSSAADDATQATFLALIRQASRAQPDALAGWLLCVARRICRKSRLSDQRRKRRENAIAGEAIAQIATDDLSMREVLALLDEELVRLPDRYRSPLLACYWQGQTQAEAARQMRITPSALKGLLERGRAKLLARLKRRGLTAEVALHGLLVAPLTLAASPGDLSAQTCALVKGPVPAGIASLLPATGLVRWGAGAFAALVVGAGLILIPGALPQDPKKNPPPAPVNNPAPKPRVDALGDPLPEAALLRLGTLRFKHPNSADGLVLSPDGKVIVTEGSRQLIAWDAATGKQLWANARPTTANVIGSAAGENSLAFTPDGKWLITPVSANVIAIWDMETGRHQLVTLKDVPAPVQGQMSAVDVAPDGKSLLVGNSEGAFLTSFEGAVAKKFPSSMRQARNQDDRLLFPGDYCFARFSPDGKAVAVTGNQSKILRIYDAANGEERKEIELSAYLVRLAFSPDSKRVAVTERDSAVRLYDVESGKRLHSWVVELHNPFENYTSAVAFSPDGKLVAAGATDHVIYLWDTTTGKEAGRLKGTGWYPWGLAFSSDGKTLYSTGWDGVVRRWDVEARKQLPLPQGAVHGGETAAAAPDGKMLAYADDAGVLRIVDARNGEELKQLKTDKGGASRLAFSRDSRLLAVGGSHADQVHVILWDVAAGKVQRRWDWEKGRDPHSSVEDIAFSPDDKQIAVAVFRRNEVRILDVAGEKQRQVTHDSVYGLDFSPDGKTLATAGWDKHIRLWDPATGELGNQAILNLDKLDTRMYGVRYSPDGRRLATALLDNQVVLWDARRLTVENRFSIENRFIFNALAFSPDGLRLATGDGTGHVRVWDSETGAKLWDRGEHGGHMYIVSFGRDSRTLLAGGNGVGYLWDMRPADLPKKELPELWKDLTGTDAVAADRAFWALVERPAETVDLFAKNVRFKKVEPADTERVGRLIGELDDGKFAKREAATAELAKMGMGIMPHLKKALLAGGSAEKQRRLRELIDKLGDDDATVRRHQRFVAVLRHLETPSAAELLRDWAKNATGSLGEFAAAALAHFHR
jgi:RNA polymerase sigma factor (sigma-70 family)